MARGLSHGQSCRCPGGWRRAAGPFSRLHQHRRGRLAKRGLWSHVAIREQGARRPGRDWIRARGIEAKCLIRGYRPFLWQRYLQDNRSRSNLASSRSPGPLRRRDNDRPATVDPLRRLFGPTVRQRPRERDRKERGRRSDMVRAKTRPDHPLRRSSRVRSPGFVAVCGHDARPVQQRRRWDALATAARRSDDSGRRLSAACGGIRRNGSVDPSEQERRTQLVAVRFGEL